MFDLSCIVLIQMILHYICVGSCVFVFYFELKISYVNVVCIIQCNFLSRPK